MYKFFRVSSDINSLIEFLSETDISIVVENDFALRSFGVAFVRKDFSGYNKVFSDGFPLTAREGEVIYLDSTEPKTKLCKLNLKMLGVVDEFRKWRNES